MRIINHERSGKPEQLPLDAQPMTIWLTRTKELRIEKGDALQGVASIIKGAWPVSEAEARKVAAYYFALGERRARTLKDATNGQWSKAELRTLPTRRYLLD